jgi:small subunit ribosomal protein S1
VNAYAQGIADRIGLHGRWFHYARETLLKNAGEFVDYLAASARKSISDPNTFVKAPAIQVVGEIDEIRARIAKRIKQEVASDVWPEVDGKFDVGQSYPGKVDGKMAFGLFVEIAPNVVGLLHISKLPDPEDLSNIAVGDRVTVEILAVNRGRKRLSLRLIKHEAGN